MPAPPTTRLFRVHCSDPPWKFGDSLPGPGRGAAKHYPTLTIPDLMAFPQPRMLPDSLLFLWRVSSMVEEAYQVMRAWGFKPHSEIVWEKTTSTGLAHFGMGRIFRGSHETCIVGVRGKPEITSHSVRSRFAAPVGKHSQKPAKFYEIVRELSRGPYVETFARTQRPGFTAYGNELDEAAPPADKREAEIARLDRCRADVADLRDRLALAKQLEDSLEKRCTEKYGDERIVKRRSSDHRKGTEP